MKKILSIFLFLFFFSNCLFAQNINRDTLRAEITFDAPGSWNESTGGAQDIYCVTLDTASYTIFSTNIPCKMLHESVMIDSIYLQFELTVNDTIDQIKVYKIIDYNSATSIISSLTDIVGSGDSLYYIDASDIAVPCENSVITEIMTKGDGGTKISNIGFKLIW